MKYLYIFLYLFYFSCTNDNKNKNDSFAQGFQTDEGKAADSLLKVKDCIERNDTTLKDGSYIKYIAFDTFYDVKIGINGIDTLLGFKFDCATPRGLVPNYFSHAKNKFYLRCGSGQHFREIIICELSHDKILINRFESERSYDAEYDFAYKENDNKSKLILQDILNRKRKIINVPPNDSNNLIFKTEIFRTHVVLNFHGGKRTTLSFSP